MVVLMKLKNYEKNIGIKTTIIFLIIIEIILFIFLISKKDYQYKIITGVVSKDDIAIVLVDKFERKILYKNKNAYIEDKLKKYEIEEDHGIVLKRNKKDYYEILLKIKFKKNYKKNDTLDIVLREQKYPIIKLMKMIGGR